MFCEKCGTKIVYAEGFCGNCGNNQGSVGIKPGKPSRLGFLGLVVFSVTGLILAAGTVAAIFDKSDDTPAPTAVLRTAQICAADRVDEVAIMGAAIRDVANGTNDVEATVVDKNVIMVGAYTRVYPMESSGGITEVMVASGIHTRRVCWLPEAVLQR